MNYSLDCIENDVEWDGFIAESSQGSVFLESRYLFALNNPFKRFVVKTFQGEILAGMAVMEKCGKMYPAPFPFSPYQGICFSKRINSQSNHTRVTSELKLTNFLVKNMVECYSNFSLSLSPKFSDIRPFIWYGHAHEEKQFRVVNRYTATLDLLNFSLEKYLKSIRKQRRWELKKSPVEVFDTDEVRNFVLIYEKTFKRQNIDVEKYYLALVENITSTALSQKYGRLTAAFTSNRIVSMALFIYDSHCAYYLFGANDPEFRNSFASTALIVNNIEFMAEKGLSKLDFVGVNSPNRGDFKMSFNPSLVPYYEVHLD